MRELILLIPTSWNILTKQSAIHGLPRIPRAINWWQNLHSQSTSVLLMLNFGRLFRSPSWSWGTNSPCNPSSSQRHLSSIACGRNKWRWTARSGPRSTCQRPQFQTCSKVGDSQPSCMLSCSWPCWISQTGHSCTLSTEIKLAKMGPGYFSLGRDALPSGVFCRHRDGLSSFLRFGCNEENCLNKRQTACRKMQRTYTVSHLETHSICDKCSSYSES